MNKSLELLALLESQEHEMVKHFIDRTTLHCSLVKKYLKAINEYQPGLLESILEEELDHDTGKWEEPEYTPYLHISWKYKCQGEGKVYEPPKEIYNAMHEATFHHIKSHKHHPEYWDESVTIDHLNQANRDKPSGKMVDATKMPLPYVASMMADWCAMSEEKGTDIKKWVKDNVNVRWKFNEDQVKLIEELSTNYSLLQNYLQGNFT